MDDYKENNGLEPIPEDNNMSGDMPDTPENTNQPEENQEEQTVVLNAAEVDGISITPTEDDSNNYDSEKENELCILCEKNHPDKSFGENYDLCTECRQSLIRSPLRIKGFVAVIAILIAAFVGMILLSTQIKTVAEISTGYDLLAQGKPESALSTIAPLNNIGWKTAGKVADICYSLGSMDDVSYLISNFYYDKTQVEEGEKLTWADKVGKSNINAPWNKNIKQFASVLKYDDTHSALFYEYYEKIYYGEITADEIPYDKVIAEYEETLSKTTNNVEKGVIYYYMLAISDICSKDTQTKLDYCKKIAECAPEEHWLYIDNFITFSIQTGDYETAEQYIAKMREINSESVYPDRYEAVSLRYQGEYGKAIAATEKLLETVDTHQIYTLYYDALLCHFMSGNYDKAFEYAAMCFEDEMYLTVDSVNFYALLSKQLGKDSSYTDAVEFLESYEMKLSPTVDKYLNGEITAEQLIKNGEVVFE